MTHYCLLSKKQFLIFIHYAKWKVNRRSGIGAREKEKEKE